MTDPEAVQKRADELRGECAGAPVFQWFARRELTREAKTQARPEDVAEVESVMRDAWIADRNGPGSAVAAMAIIARYGTPPLAAGSTNARNPTDRRLIIEKGNIIFGFALCPKPMSVINNSLSLIISPTMTPFPGETARTTKMEKNDSSIDWSILISREPFSGCDSAR